MDDVVADSEVERASWGWWLLALVGLLSTVAGVIILFKPGDSLETLAVIAGVFLLLDGLLELLASLARGRGNRGMVALVGVLSAIAGVILIRHPVGSVEFVALLIGIWLIAIGVIRLATVVEEWEHRGRHALAGLLELVAGIVIVANPDIGYATLAILVGIGFILNGVGMGVLGLGMRRLSKDVG